MTETRQTAAEDIADPTPSLLALDLHDAMGLPAKMQWALVRHWRAAGALDRAHALLDQIATRSGESQTWLEERARLAYAEGNHDEALALLKRRVERSPSATARVAVARLHLDSGDLDRARDISHDLSREYPDLATVASLAADVALARGDAEVARSYYLGLLDANPESLTAFLALTRLAISEGDQQSARNFLRRTLDVAAEAATPNQLATAADYAEQLGDAGRAQELRAQAAGIERERTASFVADIHRELGTRDARPDRQAPRPSVILKAQPEELAGEAGRPPQPPNPEGRTTGGASRGDASAAPQNDGRRGATTQAAGETADEPAAEAVTTTLEEPDAAPEVLEALRQQFGHSGLRPGQASVIAKVMEGRDTLAIMPTGAGKSLTFQLPAMLLPGVTLVISPLISLMKDQVDKLPPSVRARTVLINSTLSPEEMRHALAGVENGAYKLIYIAPERLRHHAFLRAIRQSGVALVVVDEAHCISMWGHDFRPDYLSIPRALPELGDPHVLAITATATPAMVDQIAAGFGRKLDLVQVSVFRPNLFYEVHHLPNREAKVSKAVEIARQQRGTGIIYVSSRKDADSIAGILRDRGVSALPYHAGLEPELRARNQELFMQGRVRVVVATVAFGMGVDKANVRFIIHLTPPPSLAAYAQESGRAGRDRQRARCVLLVAPSDQATLNRNATRDEMEIDTLRRVYAGLKHAATGSWAIVEPRSLLARTFDDEDDDADPRVALGILEQANLIRRHPDAPVSYTLTGIGNVSATGESPAWQRFLAWLGPDQSYGAVIRTAEACDALDLTPRELDLFLNDQDGLIVRDGPRMTCVELLPVTGNASATMTQLLDRARADARRRIRQVMDYASGSRCRHAVLAAHLGERLKPCETSCDVCAGSAQAAEQATKAKARSLTTAADALAVLEAVRTLPFNMGRTGLVKLLTGSVESRVRGDRSESFGALKEVRKARVEALIDRLIDDGFLLRDLNHEFKIIQLTRLGAEATLDDLAAYEMQTRSATTQRSAITAPSAEEVDLTPDDHALLEALYEWRRERASIDAVPAYVVAHNSALRNLAVIRPRTITALEAVSGFGPTRAQKYGDDLLRLIARF
jgi:ATP-dependent DNA helicase RecQ